MAFFIACSTLIALLRSLAWLSITNEIGVKLVENYCGDNAWVILSIQPPNRVYQPVLKYIFNCGQNDVKYEPM